MWWKGGEGRGTWCHCCEGAVGGAAEGGRQCARSRQAVKPTCCCEHLSIHCDYRKKSRQV